ncbi:MAG: NAD(P)/FAD-dependent oxidoreductase, partial [Deferrisomatales bacterium]
ELLPYDRLCLATGAAPKPLGLAGDDAPNVVGFRTRADLAALEAELARGARRAVVLGGGLVGVKAAQALAARGVETALCATSGHLLSQSVDAPAGALVAAALRAAEVRVELDARPVALRAEGGRVTGVRFEPPGALEPCDLVVVGKGVAPRAELAAGFGFDVSRGVPADVQLRTPLPDVWVAGDAALTHDLAWGQPRGNALWPLAVEQGALAGRNLAGAGETYPGSLAMNSLWVGDLHVVSAGIVTPPDPTYREHAAQAPGRGTYRKLVTRDGILVGAVFAGNADQAGLLVAAVRARTRLDDLPFDPLADRLHWGRYAFAGS